MNLVFLDLETTGLDPSRHGIVEIGAIFENDGKEAGAFQSLVNPGSGYEISSEALAVNGLSLKTIQAAPSIGAALREFDKRVENYALLAGWNAKFDEAFLKAAYYKHQIPWRFDYHVLDVWALFKHRQLKGILPMSLRSMSDIWEYIGMPGPVQQKHRALEDIKMTYSLYKAL